MAAAPILIVGAGRMGGAILAGWRRADAVPQGEILICDPSPGEAAMEAVRAGAVLNPGPDRMATARTVLLAVKPQTWSGAASSLAALVQADAIVVSILAGVSIGAIAEAFPGRPIARAMPTTAAAINKATTTVFAGDPAARQRAHALFAPLGAVVDLADEDMMHVATAASGSAPAYLYAFIEALQAAAVSSGLPEDAAATLARSTIAGAAALLDATGEDPAQLRRQVTSPGGTTEAALGVLIGTNALGTLLQRAVEAATARSRELGG